MRCAFLFFLFALAGYSSSEDPPGLVWLGVEKATCGGILIEPDVVISAKSCFESQTRVIWPFVSTISKPYKHDSADLAVVFLENSWNNTVKLIHTSELSHLKQMLHIRFSNQVSSVGNWIDAVDDAKITAPFGPKPPLIGSPMWAELGTGNLRAIGMVNGERTALRLDPYFGFIASVLKILRETKPKQPVSAPPKQEFVVLPALPATPTSIRIPVTSVVAQDPIPIISGSSEPPSEQVAPRTEAKAPPPESLGCACSQVRRGSSGFWGGRFFGRFFR